MAYFFSDLNDIKIFSADNLWNPDEQKEITEAVNAFIIEGKVKFIIDLSKVEYINSIGLSILISMLTRLRSAGGDAVLCGISENTKQLLLVTRLHNTFTVVNNMKEAVEFFQMSKA
jgi:anti-sigma B factor antagonist